MCLTEGRYYCCGMNREHVPPQMMLPGIVGAALYSDLACVH